ncbi:MAG: NYN domain-containing protein [Treponema sp.]|nr:NYN domain-containing protein [Treponema sp.]
MDLENGKIAVLIDAENTQAKKISSVLQEISLYGHIITKRAYSDWTKSSKDWENVIKDNAITPIQQFSNTKGKNSSDITLVIDAMDLLYSRKYDTFVIVSSDSDFTKLVTRIHDDEIKVIGVGEQKTPQSLIKACDTFIFIENLDKEDDALEEKNQDIKEFSSGQKMLSSDKVNILKQLRKIADNDKYSDEEGWVNIGTAGNLIKRNDPSFDSRTFGFPSLLKLLKSSDKSVEVRQRNNANGRAVINEFRLKK